MCFWRWIDSICHWDRFGCFWNGLNCLRFLWVDDRTSFFMTIAISWRAIFRPIWLFLFTVPLRFGFLEVLIDWTFINSEHGASNFRFWAWRGHWQSSAPFFIIPSSTMQCFPRIALSIYWWLSFVPRLHGAASLALHSWRHFQQKAVTFLMWWRGSAWISHFSPGLFLRIIYLKWCITPLCGKAIRLSFGLWACRPRWCPRIMRFLCCVRGFAGSAKLIISTFIIRVRVCYLSVAAIRNWAHLAGHLNQW